MRERFLWIGIFVVVVSVAGNYMFFDSKQLDQPIFLDHYYTEEIYDLEGTVDLTFYYITNKQQPKRVAFVDIDGVEAYPVYDQHGFFLNDEPQIHYVQEFSHYYIVPVTIEISADQIPIEAGSDETWMFETMHVTFSDREKVKASIGKTEIAHHQGSPDVFDFSSGSSSSDGTSETSVTVLQAANIEDVLIPFADEISDELSVKIDVGMSRPDEALDVSEAGSLPLTVKKDDRLRVFTKVISDRTSFLELGLKIKGTIDNGEAFTENVYVNDMAYFPENEIADIIAEKKAGDSD
ncbi:hypothetical protein JNUCC1_01566 [Lentibacillus sp. JNUCC-1]|uniref:hypothetical protein n=1 Tax=Lentibacillus sp. JNUCC-1 TaxID=2654513 RepID=UPI0012E807CE|nr:hypothetical protein [Lentibacillus sp. JNUCC-1]MUV37760.1 hypothetical protein [Lentibacillus sp. JNUCC-1]